MFLTGVDLTKIFHIQYTEYHGDAKGFDQIHNLPVRV